MDTKLILTMLSSSTWLKKVILPIFEILLPFILISYIHITYLSECHLPLSLFTDNGLYLLEF